MSVTLDCNVYLANKRIKDSNAYCLYPRSHLYMN